MYITKEINHYVCIQHTKYDAVLRIIKLNLYYLNISFLMLLQKYSSYF